MRTLTANNVTETKACTWCGDAINSVDALFQMGKCSCCYERWMSEGRFRELALAVLRTPDPAVLESALGALSVVAKQYNV
jgi:hypothetical protein